MIHMEDMSSNQLDALISEYNWDDGFRIPNLVLSNKNCEFATAMKCFYLSDGYSYLLENKSEDSKWLQFISTLYERLLSKVFVRGCLSYKIPLTKTQIYKLRKANIPDVFLIDI